MKVKIDTKEKFNVLTIQEPILAANMTDEMSNTLLAYINGEPRHVVLKMKEVKSVDEKAAETLSSIQQKFYESNSSFVICELDPEVEKFLDDQELLEVMNITPTESEAWDIVQMEEIERELL